MMRMFRQQNGVLDARIRECAAFQSERDQSHATRMKNVVNAETGKMPPFPLMPMPSDTKAEVNHLVELVHSHNRFGISVKGERMVVFFARIASGKAVNLRREIGRSSSRRAKPSQTFSSISAVLYPYIELKRIGKTCKTCIRSSCKE
jgi:hypothetical protein